MKLRHPQTGAIYETVEGGLVRVTDESGRTGLFRRDGRWHAGELRWADPHFLGWVGGPTLEVGGGMQSARLGAPAASSSASRPAARAAPGAAASPDSERRSTTMDLALRGRKALVTAASRGIGTLNLGQVQRGLQAARHSHVTFARYQETKIRHFHALLGRWVRE